MTRRIAIHILMASIIVFTIPNIRKHRQTFNKKSRFTTSTNLNQPLKRGLYMNERYQNLKAKECQALLSPQGRQIFAQRKIDVEPVFGQIKACLGYKRCNLRGKRQVRIDMGLVLMANNLLIYNKRMTQN
ncbi:transposase [Streptococcus pneumoniae]|nr:transposase [Streptococcus pneumoniae]